MNSLRITLNNRKRFVFSAALAAVFVLLAGGANALAVNNNVWTVSKSSSNNTCQLTPTLVTTCNNITSAVNAALSGDIIVVGPGQYNESVTIPSTKDSLSLFGAQAGRDAREDRHDLTKESIVDAGGTANAFTIDAPYVVIDGFTIRDGEAGIYMNGGSFGSVSGLQVMNNIIKGNAMGVELFDTAGVVVEHNRIEDNNLSAFTGTTGYGVFGVSNFGTSINDNAFCGNKATAIGVVFTWSDVITRNTSDNDGSFAVFLYTDSNLIDEFLGASVFSHNSGRNFGAKGSLPVDLDTGPVNADAAVDIGPGNQLLEISDNDLEEGKGSIANGIAFTPVFGSSADSEGVVIKNNSIKGFTGSGIVAEADTTVSPPLGMARYCSIVGNDVDANGVYGINVEYAKPYNSNISFFDNEAEGNNTLDCRDMSVASGPSGYTLETHDTWFNNIGNFSYPNTPTSLCTPESHHHHH